MDHQSKRSLLHDWMLDKPLSKWYFVWAFFPILHVFSRQNSGLETSYALQKHNRSIEWKSWRLHKYMNIWRLDTWLWLWYIYHDHNKVIAILQNNAKIW